MMVSCFLTGGAEEVCVGGRPGQGGWEGRGAGVGEEGGRGGEAWAGGLGLV